MKRIFIIAALLGLSFLLTSCAGFFEKDNTPTPTPLKSIHQQVIPRLLWTRKVGRGAIKHDYLKMSPTVTDTAVFTSSTSGTVTSINKLNGATIWETSLREPILTGPGVGNHIVVVGCRNGNLIALRRQDGRQLWRRHIPGEIIATPAVNEQTVVVKSIDGYTRGLATHNGQELWSYQQTEPNLILRGSSAPLIHEDSVVVGYANGSLVKFDLTNGQIEWQENIAVAHGAFAVQRMIDIDADPILYDNKIYVATYQGRLAALDFNAGRILWSHDFSTYTGMVADNDALYISDAQGLVRSFNADTGLLKWRQDHLLYRIVSGPALIGRYIVVGDGEGFLHWLDKYNGHLAARVCVNSSPIYATPIVSNNIIYALTKSGHLAAYAMH